MDCDDPQKPYKQRFKGVENFLRRIAFNLGNTASQTEVKIISCIPIDVTDLQQKIISLEKQLHEANEQAAAAAAPVSNNENDKPESKPLKTERPSAVVNSALCGSCFTTKSSTLSYCNNKPSDKIRSSQIGINCGERCSKTRKSNVSFVFPALTASNNKNQCKFGIREYCDKDNAAAAIDRYRNIFRKRKRKKCLKSDNKMRTHLVYYAQHMADNPFVTSDIPVKYNNTMSKNDELCISYLNNVIRRQYDSNVVVKEFSDTSNFSRPICRDLGNSHTRISKHESRSDLCSCCHDKFRDVDYYMTKVDYDSILTNLHSSVNNTNAYYDSNLYDVIPVKESSNKIMKNNNYNEQKLEREISVEMKCWPEHFRTKQKNHPIIVNYHAEIPVKRRCNKIMQDMILKKGGQPTKSYKKSYKTKESNLPTDITTSKSCHIDCSEVYQKHCPKKGKPREAENRRTVLQKNESVATEELVNRLEVNNQSTQLDINKVEDYRELTLNEIKTILQSVLEEIKIGTKLYNNSDETTKKDVVVQKGTSQNSTPGDSTFLHSYTYNNSYNTNPNLASCSKQIAPGQLCVTGVPCHHLKCLQNFPVFIQPATGRHLCTCNYKKSSHKPQNTRPAMTTATNTEKEPSSSSETEKLIKEIYKSMAINMNYPTKDSSKSGCNDIKSSNASSNTIEVKNVGVSNKIDIKVDAEISPIQSYINQTKIRCRPTSAQSEHREQVSNMNMHSERERLQLHSIHSSDTMVEVNKETEESSDESDSDDTVVLNDYKQIKSKKGFFNKMLKSVNLFKKKKVMQTDKEASDSDDYETIYSEKTERVSPKRYKKLKTIAPHDRARTGRSPYLEQEYRRQWNENLMFHEPRSSRCTSERPILTHSNRMQTKPIYWMDYEARPAIVDAKMPNQYRNDDATHRMEQGTSPEVKNERNKERLGWLKKHKLGINCGEQWKKFILES